MDESDVLGTTLILVFTCVVIAFLAFVAGKDACQKRHALDRCTAQCAPAKPILGPEDACACLK